MTINIAVDFMTLTGPTITPIVPVTTDASVPHIGLMMMIMTDPVGIAVTTPPTISLFIIPTDEHKMADGTKMAAVLQIKTQTLYQIRDNHILHTHKLKIKIKIGTGWTLTIRISEKKLGLSTK